MKKLAKYETIYLDLKKKILEGVFQDGRLPSLSELTKSYGASLLTVNNAVKKLAEEGLVSRGSTPHFVRCFPPIFPNFSHDVSACFFTRL